MSKAFRFLDISTNILVAVVGVFLITLLAYKTFFQPTVGPFEAKLLTTGEDFVGLPEVDFKRHKNTILLAMDVKCPYCVRSVPFYKKLAATSTEDSTVQIISVFSNERAEVEQFLQEQDLNIGFIPNVDLVKLKVDATPTVIWVDENRKIVGSYRGLLHENAESAFLEVYNKRLFAK